MLIGNKLVRNIFIILGVVLIFLNLYYFIMYEGVQYFAPNNDSIEIFRHSHSGFHGTNWFFNHISSFPGFNDFFNFLDKVASGKFINLGDNGETFSFESLLDCLKIIALPFIIFGTIISSIFKNIIWLGGFFFWFSPTK